MHSWKKKLVVSQLALACTLAITSQANAANYDTWGYHDNTTTDLGKVRISTLRNENETFSQLNSITYIGVFLRLVTYSHLP